MSRQLQRSFASVSALSVFCLSVFARAASVSALSVFCLSVSSSLASLDAGRFWAAVFAEAFAFILGFFVSRFFFLGNFEPVLFRQSLGHHVQVVWKVVTGRDHLGDSDHELLHRVMLIFDETCLLEEIALIWRQRQLLSLVNE